MARFKLDEKKFKELLLLLASECKDDVFFGATKVNKQLFFADFIAFEKLGRPITGADYMALERGPVPRRLLPIRAAMIEDDELAIEQRGQQERLIPLRDPDLSVFTKQEKAVISDVIEALRSKDAETVSNLSHLFLGWQAAYAEGVAQQRYVSIPYGTCAVSNEPITKTEREQVLELAQKYEWPT